LGEANSNVPDLSFKRRRWRIGLLLALLACAMLPANGFARGSGGYSRPSFSARTPSFGGGGAYRTPSINGGYSRPAQSYARPPALPQSAGDRSFSQSRSSAALNSYRTQQRQAVAPSLPPRQSSSPPMQYRTPTTANRTGWFGDRGWSAPSQSYYGGGRSFGVWDGLFLWSLLSNLNRSGSSDFFHNNQNDPGYRQWRAEADRQAQDNADLRQKLADLDSQLAARDNQPRTPGALPADVPADIAKAPPARTPGVAQDQEGGSSWVWVVLAVGAGGLVLLAWQRRRHSTGGSSMTPANPLQSATAMVRHKLSGEAYAPSRFRVGMTLALDPAPFILAAGRIKLTQPEGSGQISVSAIGRVVSGDTQLVRLYLPGERSLVQLHLDAAGDPDECRLFGIIDEVTPADPGEWGAWLDPNEGMIGWPEFQTKDGKTYARLWAPGDARVSPRVLDESIETLAGTRTVQSQAMLYGAPTGAADPAPAAEYIMVAARQDGGRAWVEIHAGIDLNPVTLQLA